MAGRKHKKKASSDSSDSSSSEDDVKVSKKSKGQGEKRKAARVNNKFITVATGITLFIYVSGPFILF